MGESKTRIQAENVALRAEIRRLEQHVADLQSGMYVNCVYCGHRYGPRETTAEGLADAVAAPDQATALTRHVATCAKHPMARAVRVLRWIMHNVDRTAAHQHEAHVHAIFGRATTGLSEARVLLAEFPG